jgi:tetratricopeptide (TPR) repeat protein
VDPQIPSPAWGWRWLAWVFLLGLITTAARWFREVPAAFWILSGFILLIPSSSIFPAADLAADRRMYLPMLGFAPAMALLLPNRWMIVIPFLLAGLSMERTYVWASDERLWGEAVERAPGKIRAMIQLSRAVPPERALALLQDGERLTPEDPQIPTELARVDLQLNRSAAALAQAGRALALAPHEPHALNNRGAVLLAMNQIAAARRDFLAALGVDPCLTEARENLERSGGVPAEAPHCPR